MKKEINTQNVQPPQDNHHTLSVADSLDSLQTTTQGLSPDQVTKRLLQYGKNVLPSKKPTPLLLRFLAQMSDAMVMVLIAAALISGAVALSQKEYSELIDGGIILLIVIVNAVIGLIQQDRANNAMDALKNMSKPFAKVKREGVIVKIASEDLVPGDMVVLEAGDSVPADLRLVNCVNLKTQESALTGESLPCEKSTTKLDDLATPLGDRKNMAYSTSTVVYGRGEGVVVATGIHTQVGKIATLLSQKDKGGTPLQKQLAKTAKILSFGVLGIAAIIFATSFFVNKTPIIAAFLTTVAIAVAAIPEGLPAVVTIVLAMGVRVMSTQKAIVRNIPSVEVLGSTQVICSDKTGTLTQNKMTVTTLHTLGTTYQASTPPRTQSQKVLSLGMALCNDTVVSGDHLLGDPTETALTAYARMHAVDFSTGFQRISEIPFDSDRKLMSVEIADTHNQKASFTKGAFDRLIAKCTHIAVDNGGTETALLDSHKMLVRPITRQDIDALKTTCENFAKQALRVLALGINTQKHAESDLVFVGLMAMIDPPREEVKAAIQECKTAQIKTVMITGDHAITAEAIAREIGIEGKVTDGASVDTMSDQELNDTILDYGVFARVSPSNKVRLVKAFKSNDKITAMTGDGVNDAPALNAADIGIGMGITGTDVAKGASDMVLADDNFATIVTAVKEGRKVFSNIKKSIKFLLSANIAEVLCLFVVTVFFKMTFLTPVMILWVNLVTDSLPALALGLEKAENDIMQKPPTKQSNLLKGKFGMQIFVQGIMQTALVLASFFVGLYVIPPHGVQSYEHRHTFAMTMAFVTLCLIQLFHAYNCRSEHNSVLQGNPLQNRTLNLSFVIGVALIALVVFVPPIAKVFELEALDLQQTLTAILLSLAIIPFVEIYKICTKKS
ncbi:MAG: cation-translocating P-type ATPase [Firmicutes bacterium]|nr:cation-translocating P-type ATPase [Bacillota bacterium]